MKLREFKIQRLTLYELMFFIAYDLFIVSCLLSTSFYRIYIEDFTKGLIIFCCGLLVLRELLLRKISRKNILSIVAILLLFGLSFMGSRNAQNIIPAMFLFIYSARNIKFEKIAKNTLTISMTVLIFVILSAKLGIIQEYHATQWQNGRARERNYLGFLYALYPSTIVFNITCLIVYLKKDKLKPLYIILLILVNYWFFKQTDSRLTCFLSVFVLVAAIMLIKLESKMKKKSIVLSLTSFSYVFCFVISLYLTIIYTPSKKWMKMLNSFLGNRLSFGKASLLKHGIPILGQNISWSGSGLNALGERSTTTYDYVDSLYIQILQHYGIIFTAVFLALMTILMFKIKNNGNIYLFLIIATVALHFLVDNLQLYLHYNTFWLVAGGYVMNDFQRLREKRRSEKKLPSMKRTIDIR